MSSRLVMAAGSRNTKRLLSLLNDWPVDKTRKGRDLGELLHKRVGEALKPAAAASSVDDKVSKLTLPLPVPYHSMSTVGLLACG